MDLEPGKARTLFSLCSDRVLQSGSVPPADEHCAISVVLAHIIAARSARRGACGACNM